MNWAEDIAGRLDRGVHRFDPEADNLSEFKYAGLRCVIARGAYGANGYVRLSWRLRRRLRYEMDIAEAIGFFRHLSYVDHRSGWVGFDTGMIGDVWPIGDAVRYSLDEETARHLGLQAARVVGRLAPRHDWSMASVRTNTMALADCLSTYGAWEARRRRLENLRPTRRRSMHRKEA